MLLMLRRVDAPSHLTQPHRDRLLNVAIDDAKDNPVVPFG